MMEAGRPVTVTDATAGRAPRDIAISQFDCSLEPGEGGRPQPVVQGLRLRISPAGLRTLTQGLVDEADRRAPVGLSLKDVRVSDAGIDLAMRIEKSIFRSDLAMRLVLTAPGGDLLRVELTNVEMPAWAPLDLIFDEAVRRGGGAILRDPASKRALALDPAALVARFGLPGRFAPGTWAVDTSPAGLDLAFQERA